MNCFRTHLVLQIVLRCCYDRRAISTSSCSIPPSAARSPNRNWIIRPCLLLYHHLNPKKTRRRPSKRHLRHSSTSSSIVSPVEFLFISSLMSFTCTFAHGTRECNRLEGLTTGSKKGRSWATSQSYPFQDHPWRTFQLKRTEAVSHMM